MRTECPPSARIKRKFGQRVYESGRRCAEVDAEGVIAKTDRGKKHSLYNLILRSLAWRVLR